MKFLTADGVGSEVGWKLCHFISLPGPVFGFLQGHCAGILGLHPTPRRWDTCGRLAIYHEMRSNDGAVDWGGRHLAGVSATGTQTLLLGCDRQGNVFLGFKAMQGFGVWGLAMECQAVASQWQ